MHPKFLQQKNTSRLCRLEMTIPTTLHLLENKNCSGLCRRSCLLIRWVSSCSDLHIEYKIPVLYEGPNFTHLLVKHVRSCTEPFKWVYFKFRISDLSIHGISVAKLFPNYWCLNFKSHSYTGCFNSVNTGWCHKLLVVLLTTRLVSPHFRERA